MKIFNHSFDSPARNLACDEVLLNYCEENHSEEILRFWTTRRYFVVLGLSNRWKEEIRILPKTEAVPIFRRPSGGGTVLQGPGCLNYTLILKIQPPYDGILSANQAIMEKQRSAMQSLLKKPVRIQGSTDLTVDSFKFSGNAQKRKKNYLLFHGTFLLNFDLERIEKHLLMPPKKPEYRNNRGHLDFLSNINAAKADVISALTAAWKAHGHLENYPEKSVKTLADEKYSSQDWNLKY